MATTAESAPPDVAGDEETTDFLGHFGPEVSVHVEHGNRRTGRGQLPRFRCRSEARRSAGDDRNLFREVHDQAPSLGGADRRRGIATTPPATGDEHDTLARSRHASTLDRVFAEAQNGGRRGASANRGSPIDRMRRIHLAADDGSGGMDLGESCVFDGFDRVRRRIASVADETPGPTNGSLEPSDRGLVGGHVLDEQEAATGSQDPADLLDHRRLVTDAAENQRRHDGGHTAVGEPHLS